jgi:MFS family permease
VVAPGTARARLALAALGVLLAAADTYVVVVALPEIMSGVGLASHELQKAAPILSAFLLGYVATLPLVGRLADVYGPTRVLVLCFGIFALGSLFTATAHGLGPAVMGRGLQGLGGGGLVPATLALVAQMWPPERRGMPLGAVGAVQELGSVLGPLFGAVVLSVSGWRAIFWLNLALALALAAALRGDIGFGLCTPPPPGVENSAQSHDHRGRDRVGLALAGVAVAALTLALVAPTRLVDDVTLGLLYLPFAGSGTPGTFAGLLTPLGAAALGCTGLLVLRDLATPRGRRPVLGLRGAGRLARSVDLVGALLLGVALSAIVLTFAAADPERQAIADGWPVLLGVATAAAAGFAVRQARAGRPLVPRDTLAALPAKGALVVSFFVGAALVAALVVIPIFARITRYPESQLDAALVLLRLLVALPVGALLGGWLAQRVSYRLTAGGGMLLAAAGLTAMSRWDDRALYSFGSDVALVVTGLGFGLAIAPVNAALLAATRRAVHGVASGLVVTARMVGMLVGLSALTAIGLRVFHAALERIPPPTTLCPRSPARCPEYRLLVSDAALQEISAIFVGAAVCALTAAALSFALLGRLRAEEWAE